MFPDLSRRFEGMEMMDRPDCDRACLYRTLAQFRWVNLGVSRYRSCLKRWIVADMLRDRLREYHLVDLGAGGCDIPVWLLAYCRRRGLKLKVTALDMDARTVAWARDRYSDVLGLKIVCGNAFDLDKLESVDYVYANHFLHHLEDDEIVRLLGEVRRVAGRGFLVCDLRRCRFSYLAFSLLAGALLRGSFARADGLISIRKGFTQGEFERVISGVGMRGQVYRMFPGRLVGWGER